MELRGIRRSCELGRTQQVETLHGINLKLHRGEFLALMGASGSGRSTLLNIVGLLDRPSAGQVLIGGEDTSRLGMPRSRGCAAMPSVSCFKSIT